MPRVTPKAKSNDGLVALYEVHPDAPFEVLGARSYEEGLGLLVETGAPGVDPLTKTLVAVSGVTGFEIRHAGSDRFLLRVPR